MLVNVQGKFETSPEGALKEALKGLNLISTGNARCERGQNVNSPEGAE
jgi:hypothetical protein